MIKIDPVKDCSVTTNSKHTLSVALASATLLAVLPFFVGRVLLLLQGLAPLVVQAGIVRGTGQRISRIGGEFKNI